MNEASTPSRGMAANDELLAALNQLLEAERAGTRVALDSAKAVSPPGYAELMHQVRADEAHWCAMLDGHIRRLGGAPSGKTGDFHRKAMAIPDPRDRLSFLNRGQQWVVRKLEELLPHITDEQLCADLRDMAQRHRASIAGAEGFLSRS